MCVRAPPGRRRQEDLAKAALRRGVDESCRYTASAQRRANEMGCYPAMKCGLDPMNHPGGSIEFRTSSIETVANVVAESDIA